MAFPVAPKKTFDFQNYSTLFPTRPQPGDEIDRQFQEVIRAATETLAALKTIQRDDLQLANASVHLETLAPDVLNKIIASVTPNLTASLNASISYAAQAAASATNAQTYLANIQQASNDAIAAAGAAATSEQDAQTAANIAASAAAAAANSGTFASNAENHAKASETKADAYWKMSQAWAEYLPDTIPPRFFPDNSITGDHWSARWWANKAANAFGFLTSLYLGVHPDHAAAIASVTNPPIAIGSIYYNSTDSKPYVWTGSAWQAFWQPQKALTTTLYYIPTAPQAAFSLATADINAQTFTLDKVDTEPVEVFLNGVRLLPTLDYSVDPKTNTVTFVQNIPPAAVVTIDILTPQSKMANGTVNFRALLDIDLDPATRAPGRIDGTQTTFSLARTDGGILAINNAVELLVSVDGIIQHSGVDYNVMGSRIIFTDAPRADSKVWAIWMEPGGTGAGGKGVQPPQSPDDAHINAYVWDPIKSIGFWQDIRLTVHTTPNTAGRLALKDPEELLPGALVYQEDTHDFWVYTPPALPPAAGVTVRADIAPVPGDPGFKTAILKLKVGDTVLYKGQYYQVMVTPTLGEESFPGGTSYAINPAPFTTQFSPVAGPSWNNYKALAPGQVKPAAAAPTGPAGDPTQLTNWSMLLPGHPSDNILRSLEYDPSKPNKMAWEDARDQMETVGAVADLNNRVTLPLSHLAVGKLVYVRATGELWECLVDGSAGTVTNTLTDWKQLGGGLKYVGTPGNLPASGIPDGALYIVNMNTNGNPFYQRLMAWDAANKAWVFAAPESYAVAKRTDPVEPGDFSGDLQSVYEPGHAKVSVFDGSAWHTLYDEDLVKQWIAASNLFQGTVEDKGHGTAGAIDLDNLPAQSALGITDAGHYYIYVGQAGHVIGAAEIGGGASNINGAKLNVGDWILVANTGTPAAPAMKYTHIPGDLLAKSRGDSLYGLNTWAAGAYESGSLVVYQGDVYKASKGVVLADVAPGLPLSPWVKVDISGGVKTVTTDSALPATASAGAVYLVISSAKAGGRQALYSWDALGSKWQALGGSGVPLDLTGGKKLVNYGTPIGTVITYAGKTLPAGYLLCDGAAFDGTVYPELLKVLGGTTLPDLRNQFIRGAATLNDVSMAKHAATTARPTTPFTGITNRAGAHTHGIPLTTYGADPGRVSMFYDGNNVPSPQTTNSAGAHEHTVAIDGGGDAETAPDHVILAYLIKADDIGVHGL